MLSDRRQKILAALIEEYVARALPVGSRTLAEHYGFDVSPATIRNDLSALEDDGLISQPHTSAGRIPTDTGYRAFVDSLVSSGAIDQDEETLKSLNQLRQTAKELDDLLDTTSQMLARFTDCLSIVAPSQQNQLKQIGITSLMRQPEFEHSASLMPIMQILEDSTTLFHVLDTTVHDSADPQVKIGKENEDADLSGVSVIACRYGLGDDGGIVAIIGPTRMNYTRAIAAVRLASRTLG